MGGSKKGEEGLAEGAPPSFPVLATDYDGTLAEHGRVAPETVAALERWRAADGRAILVSGRQLEDLQSVFSRLDLFDLAVLENGALLFLAADGTIELLADPPPSAFVEALAGQGVEPLAQGRVIIATLLPTWRRCGRRSRPRVSPCGSSSISGR